MGVFSVQMRFGGKKKKTVVPSMAVYAPCELGLCVVVSLRDNVCKWSVCFGNSKKLKVLLVWSVDLIEFCL